MPACALTVARGGEGQNENIEELTIELDENLRRHRPRAGRVEEDVARAREVQLLAPCTQPLPSDQVRTIVTCTPGDELSI